jgi:peptidase E
MTYNYKPKNSKDFLHNANIITQYADINDDEYYNYYHNTALIYVVQIDKESVNNFADYIKNNPIKTVYSDAVKYIQNKEKHNEQQYNNLSK